MCFSTLGQIAYGLLMFAATVLTAVALFTPGWSIDTGTDKNLVYSRGEGIMSYTCAKFYKDDDCSNWWSAIPSWQHVVIVCMWMALFAECLALLWNLLTLMTCCFKKCLLHPIIPLAIVSTILLAIAVIVYGVNGKEFIIYGHLKDPKATPPTAPEQPGTLGYSFYLAMSALILSAADVVIAIISVFFAELCC